MLVLPEAAAATAQARGTACGLAVCGRGYGSNGGLACGDATRCVDLGRDLTAG